MVVWGSRLITGIYWNTKKKHFISVIITRTKFSFQICTYLSLRQFSTVFLFSSMRSVDVEQANGQIIWRNTAKQKHDSSSTFVQTVSKTISLSLACTELKFFIIYEEDPRHFQLGQSLYLNIHWHIVLRRREVSVYLKQPKTAHEKIWRSTSWLSQTVV